MRVRGIENNKCCMLLQHIKWLLYNFSLHEGARNNVSIYESSSHMVLKFREYNKELKFFKLKLCVTFLIKIIHVRIFFYRTRVSCQT